MQIKADDISHFSAGKAHTVKLEDNRFTPEWIW